ncbi:MAG: fused MFS/spermidine synthase [Proteobacteria bacterium]|nr:fused MFS/spermidine synthase [Pseudomonadota bacterium]
MTVLLCLIFFLSGASALVFEMLWFQLAGLSFGSSVWAASLVLASFMGGLALGNGLMAWRGSRVRRPIVFYAAAEAVIGATGLGLVLLFPHLSGLLAPLFSPFLDQPLLLNFLRAAVAVCLMVVPATAMGATLPLLVRALYARVPNFGRVLGGLYGWNTLGAVAGVMAAEMILVPGLGLRGSGFVAAGANLVAACLALWVNARVRGREAALPEDRHAREALSGGNSRFLVAAFLSGFILLALEVVWFRFLLLYIGPYSWPLAVMLASVLLGIAAGGLAASRWFVRDPDAHRHLSAILLAGGCVLVLLYAGFGRVQGLTNGMGPRPQIISICLYYLFPVSFLSGIVFTMLGRALHFRMGSETRASGLLTLANTTGAMAGSLLAPVLFLPVLGMEKTFFAFALLYGLVALLTLPSGAAGRGPGRAFLAAAGLAWVTILALFPFGLMEAKYLNAPYRSYLARGEERVALREGVTETIQYLEQKLLGEPYYHRLVTNNHSMSATDVLSRRYMKMYVWLPMAVNPGAKNALLMCFGCGQTAKALTDTRTLTNIDMVDISRDVVDMAKVVYPDPAENPVNDPRVRVYIEDGRFFLLTSQRKYDIITGEPPPPLHSSVVNLYSREYFELVKNALAPGGVFTYWLPVMTMNPAHARSILRAFLDVFPQGSLWTGSGYEWMMVAVRDPASPPDEEAFTRQWRDPGVFPEMQATSLTRPGQLGTMFMADGNRLAQWVGDALPVEDDHPRRLGFTTDFDPDRKEVFRAFMMDPGAEKNFFQSPGIARMWPEPVKEKTRPHFQVRDFVVPLFANPAQETPQILSRVLNCMESPLLRDYVLWAFLSTPRAGEIARQRVEKNPEGANWKAHYHLGALAASQGRLLEAERHFEQVGRATGPRDWQTYFMRIYLLYRGGRAEEARRLKEEYAALPGTDREMRVQSLEAFWKNLLSLPENRG